MWKWKEIQEVLWQVGKGVIMENIYLLKDKLKEIKAMVGELGKSL